MSFLIDSSALIHLLRDRTGTLAARYDSLIGDNPVALSRITAFEILKGAKTEQEWRGLMKLLSEETLLAPADADWVAAARTVFDLQRNGITLSASIDCVVAEAALTRGWTLVHDDKDFERIATVRPLKLQRFQP